jgi:deoxyribonuclease-4
MTTLKKNFLIGHSLNISHGFTTTVDYAKEIGANFFQLFLTSPQNYSLKRHSTDELKLLNEKLKKNSIKIVIHSSYMLNFCNPQDSEIHKRAVKLLCQDLTESVQLNSVGVIVHMGKSLKLNIDDAVNNYVTGIKTVLSKTNKSSTIIFETGAGQGSEICSSIFDLGRLYNKFTKEEKKRIKFCIDTCHIFSVGYDIGHEDFVDVFDELVKRHLKWENVFCIHLNDSKCKLNSRKDRHCDLTKGFINEKGLKKFTKLCVAKNIPIVLETPCDTISKKDQITLVRSWLEE